MSLPTELLIHINSFICKKHFDIEKDILEALHIPRPLQFNPCETIKYKDIHVCKIHDDENLYKCFTVLKQITNKNIVSIHFETAEICLLALPYISDFGNVIKHCCSGTGIMFKNYDKRIEYLEYTP
jgi:hypothetical protein